MFEALDIDLGGQWIRGKLWGPITGLPTIALHGYLDNANSFDELAPLLRNHRIFAMDFAGHGASNHRGPHELYAGLLDIRDVLAVADHFGWPQFHLLGIQWARKLDLRLPVYFQTGFPPWFVLMGFAARMSCLSRSST